MNDITRETKEQATRKKTVNGKEPATSPTRPNPNPGRPRNRYSIELERTSVFHRYIWWNKQDGQMLHHTAIICQCAGWRQLYSGCCPWVHAWSVNTFLWVHAWSMNTFLWVHTTRDGTFSISVLRFSLKCTVFCGCCCWWCYGMPFFFLSGAGRFYWIAAFFCVEIVLDITSSFGN